jgi:hypothetical protein
MPSRTSRGIRLQQRYKRVIGEIALGVRPLFPPRAKIEPLRRPTKQGAKPNALPLRRLTRQAVKLDALLSGEVTLIRGNND